jgi:predicted metalloprotease with PDZ domain
MPAPANHLYHVTLSCKTSPQKTLHFNMSAWTPGFYEIVDFAAAVSNFHVKDAKGDSVKWQKNGENTWEVSNAKPSALTVTYDVKAENPFIGNIYLDEHYGYIIPGALLLYLNEALKLPVTVQVIPYTKWPAFIATGLNPLPGKSNTFRAANFDELFDSPILAGNLETFPSFTVKGIPHYFIGYNLGNFDRKLFMTDLKKIVEAGVDIIGDIPYTHYTFLGIGFPGGGSGGIEHLNSASLLIGNKNLMAPGREQGFYSFLAHEYFHLYNVKRIRPVELGPFDYSKENYTNLLWISEGFTDYYEYLMMRKAKLMTDRQALNEFEQHIRNYENKPGHLYQSANAASRGIWAIRGNPFARTEGEIDSTISVYDKGCILGLLLDLKIRHETANKHSLDDVMRSLYHDYFQVKKRGFTEKEFQQQCERIAGVSLADFFSYTSTVNPIDYPTYFSYAGMKIDTTDHSLPGNDLGISAGLKDSAVVIRDVTWKSPAWKAGLQQNDQILFIDSLKAGVDLLSHPVPHNGDSIYIRFIRDHQERNTTVRLSPWSKKTFAISQVTNPTSLQYMIYNSWMRLL